VALTISDTLSWALDVLTAAKVESPRVDAEIIICHFTSLKKADLYAEPARVVDDVTSTAIRDAVTDRTSGTPVQYIVCEADFLGHTIRVNPSVLIPRPETELLAVEAIDFLNAALSIKPPWGPMAPLAADVGTGSGAIAIALAKAVSELTVYATDKSKDALELAADNAASAGVSSRVTFLDGSMMEPLRDAAGGKGLTAIVSNPPYVTEGEWRSLPDVVKDYEPRGALLAGPEGLDYIAELIGDGPDLLAPGGLLAFEMGAWQWPKVARLLYAQTKLGCFRVIRDLAGYERIATAIRIG
jgi:release factor glutamine methyltransferase